MPPSAVPGACFRRRILFAMGWGAVLLACAAPRPAPQESSRSAAPDPPGVPPQILASQAALDTGWPALACSRLVPEEFADRWLHRAEMTEKPRGPGRVTCTFSGGVLARPISLDFICSESVVQERFLAQARERFGKMAYREVSDLGRLAFAREDMQVVAWDDDAPCLVVLTAFQSRIDIIEMAREYLRRLSPPMLRGL